MIINFKSKIHTHMMNFVLWQQLAEHILQKAIYFIATCVLKILTANRKNYDCIQFAPVDIWINNAHTKYHQINYYLTLQPMLLLMEGRISILTRTLIIHYFLHFNYISISFVRKKTILSGNSISGKSVLPCNRSDSHSRAHVDLDIR